jgi:hypothetical protein
VEIAGVIILGVLSASLAVASVAIFVTAWRDATANCPKCEVRRIVRGVIDELTKRR